MPQDIASAANDLVRSLGSMNVASLGTVTTTATIPPPFADAEAQAGGAPAGASITRLTLGGNTAITLPTPAAGQRFEVILTQDGTGSRVPTWVIPGGGTLKWAGAVHTLSTAAGAIDRAMFRCVDGTNFLAELSTAYA